MKRTVKTTPLAAGILAVVLVVGLRVGLVASAAAEEAPSVEATTPTEVDHSLALDEARGQAELLHETLHATLQVVHRRYYREDEGLPIPSRTLESVFNELERRRGVEFRWLAVNAQAMSIDHEPQNGFEHSAVKALKSGEESFEQVEADVYRRAGAITLFSQCLKCHAPNRMSTRDRLEGLIISIPNESD